MPLVLLDLEAKEALGTVKASTLGNQPEVVEKEAMVLRKASISLQEQEIAKAIRTHAILTLRVN